MKVDVLESQYVNIISAEPVEGEYSVSVRYVC